MNEGKISVIIPAYNSERFIADLINDLLVQSYQNFEAIIVDDGSFDNTYSKAATAYGNDSRFKYIYKNNGGASSARNTGIKSSSANLITFIDSDDRIAPNYLELLSSAYNASKADIVSYKICDYRKGKRPIRAKTLDTTAEIIDSFFNEEFGIGPTSKLYKRSLIGDTQFDETLIINEDKLFLFEYLKKCSSAFISPESIYFVKTRSDSISHSTSYTRRGGDLLYVQNRIYKSSISKKDDYHSLKKHNIKNYLFIYKVFLNSFKFKKSNFDKNILQEINIKLAESMMLKGEIPFKQKLEMFLYKNANCLYNAALKIYYARKRE